MITVVVVVVVVVADKEATALFCVCSVLCILCGHMPNGDIFEFLGNNDYLSDDQYIRSQ